MPDRFRAHTARVAVEELPAVPIAVLRLRRPAVLLLHDVAEALGTPLPREPGTTAGVEPRLYWIAPDEWMIIGSNDRLATLEAAVAGATAHVAHVGGGRRRFRVSGVCARDLLAKGTSLDVHPRVFDIGRCARTLFAQTSVLIERCPAADTFDLFADVSYAAHLRRWFADALVEFEDIAL